MGLVHRETGSGLVLAEEAQDEASITRALKQIDPRYVLQKHPGEVEGGWVYKVFCIVNDSEPPIAIMSWSDDRGRPLPLSFGLVEEVKKWRPENRGRRGPDADERNRRLREQTDQLRRDQLEAISDDHRPFVERNRLGVALDVKPKKRYWQRGNALPESGGPRR